MRKLLASDLAKFGAIESSIRWLDEASPQNINYLDLIPSCATRPINKNDLWPSAVIESAGVATAYILRADTLSSSPTDNARLNSLRHRLACRGGMTYLVAWNPGEMSLYPVGLSSALPGSIRFSLSIEVPDFNLVIKDTPGYSLLFQDVANAVLKTNSEKQSYETPQARQLIFYILGKVALAIDSIPVLQDYRHDANSLVTHALFTRILIDRGIINKTTFPAIFSDGHPERCFDTPELAALTCQWLYDNFNGELPSLSDNNYANYFSLLASKDAEVFTELSKIFHKPYEDGTLSFDMYWLDLYWDTINFAHVPVDILSQAYEHCRRILYYQNDDEDNTGDTPKSIAEFLTDQALAGITTAPIDQAKIFDAESSNAIRLNLYLRKLVAARWVATGNRPDKKEIEDILYGQIFGCDINQAALQIGVLTLYLTALELDPESYQQESLKFDALSDINFYVAPEGIEKPARHKGKYDLVIGNQPDDSLSFSNVIHALFFTKKSGVTVFEPDASLLTDCSENGLDMRNALFSMIRVTGVLNGGDIDTPFYLMFAVKLKSSDSDIFYMLSPAHDEHLWKAERFRIDYSGAQPIQLSVLRDNPSLINVLTKGTTLDADVIRRVRALLPPNSGSPGDDNSNEVEDVPLPRNRPVAIRLGDYWELNPGYIASGDFPVEIEQSLFSFSSEQHPDRKNIEKYLYVLTNSELFHYYMLMTTLGSPNTDQEIYAEDIDNFPIIAYEQISLPKKNAFLQMMLGLDNKSDEIVWDKLNEWVYDLYRLDTPDQQIIADTLATRAPNQFVRSSANQIPDDEQINGFCSKIETSLKSFCAGNITCRKNNIYSRSWIFIDVISNEFKESGETYSPAIKLLEKLSENEGATRVILDMDKGYLCVAIIAQRMFFTMSRAQLCALEILRHHADFIPESVDG